MLVCTGILLLVKVQTNTGMTCDCSTARACHVQCVGGCRAQHSKHKESPSSVRVIPQVMQGMPGHVRATWFIVGSWHGAAAFYDALPSPLSPSAAPTVVLGGAACGMGGKCTCSHGSSMAIPWVAAGQAAISHMRINLADYTFMRPHQLPHTPGGGVLGSAAPAAEAAQQHSSRAHRRLS